MAEGSALETSMSNGVATIRLCRPEVHNRFDFSVHAELHDALLELGADPAVLAVVLASTGRHFSAGGDTDTMIAAAEDLTARMNQIDEGRRLFRTFADFPKPVVVALHGDVYGVATSIVLTADAIVAAKGVKLSDPHVHLGLVAGDGGCVTWPMNLPLVTAKRHLLWGDPLLAEDAHRLGMVTDLVETPDDVPTVAFALAERVAALPPVAVQLTKRALNKYVHSRIDDVFDTAFYLEAISVATEDLREAVDAFRERRPGRWQGR